MKLTNTQHFSGITVAEYRQIMKGDITVQFVCTQCKSFVHSEPKTESWRVICTKHGLDTLKMR